MDKGLVYYQDQQAGIIELGKSKVYVFTYDSDYIKDGGELVSQTLPLQQEPFESDVLFPFFDGLIPEGWLLDVAADTWKISPSDRWRLLLKVCQDCIGAVKIIADES